MNKQDYHSQTAYSRRKMSGHALDWDHRPVLYKNYPQVESVALPREGASLPEATLWDLLLPVSESSQTGPLELADLSRILGLSYGITASVRYPHEVFHYRSAPSAGALYPCEIYVAAYDVAGLDPGVYYFDVADFDLKKLRPGDNIPFFTDNAGQGLAASLFITGIAFRSAWKYRARAYRYVLLDTGHLLGNLALVLRALGRAYGLTYDLDDKGTGRLLGLDLRREAGVARLDLGSDPDLAAERFHLPDDLPLLPDDITAASRVSSRERFYPEIEAMLATGNPAPDFAPGGQAGSAVVEPMPAGFQPIGPAAPPDRGSSAVQALVRRRSSRNFIPAEIPQGEFRQLLVLLKGALSGGLAMGPSPGDGVSLGFLAGTAEGLEPGFYLLDQEGGQVGCVAAGQLVSPMAAACLDQAWLKNAGVHFLFMLNPERLAAACGPRGYRYAMVRAGFLGQLIYLGATALGLGACGIGAIYDDEARNLLRLNDGWALGYLVAAGVVKRTK